MLPEGQRSEADGAFALDQPPTWCSRRSAIAASRAEASDDRAKTGRFSAVEESMRIPSRASCTISGIVCNPSSVSGYLPCFPGDAPALVKKAGFPQTGVPQLLDT